MENGSNYMDLYLPTTQHFIFFINASHCTLSSIPKNLYHDHYFSAINGRIFRSTPKKITCLVTKLKSIAIIYKNFEYYHDLYLHLKNNNRMSDRFKVLEIFEKYSNTTIIKHI